MENGIYQVRLSSERNCVEGLVVFLGDTFNGGGGGYICQGTVLQENQMLSGKLIIRKWDHQASDTLGLFKEISMVVAGGYDPEKRRFHLKGEAKGHHVIPIDITGRWVAALIRSNTPEGKG